MNFGYGRMRKRAKLNSQYTHPFYCNHYSNHTVVRTESERRFPRKKSREWRSYSAR
jgi:hypothetical protein